MTGPKNALAAWGRSSLRYVELPTGTKMLLRLPNVADLALKDMLPSDLRDLAMKYAKDGIDVTALPPEDLGRFVAFTYELIARMIRYIAPADSDVSMDPDDPGWEAVSISAGELREMDVDQADLDALGQIAGRRVSTFEITATTRAIRALVNATDDVAAEAAQGESVDSVGDLATFRRQSAGAPDGPGRAGVAPEPERASLDRGRGHRVRSRRGGRSASDLRPDAGE